MLAGIIVSIALVAVAYVIDRMNIARSLESLQATLSSISQPVLRLGNTDALQQQLDEGAIVIIPSFAVYDSMLPLITLDEFEGQISPPSWFSFEPAVARVSARANFSRGISDVNTTAVFKDGQWRIQRYEVVRGPLAQ